MNEPWGDMKIVSCQEMRAREEAAFAAGSTAEELMEAAGESIAAAVRQFFPHRAGNPSAEIFYGKGNNGGDGLVAARHLATAGWSITLRAQEPDVAKLSELTRRKLGELSQSGARVSLEPPPRSAPRVVLDALLGIGATGPLRDPIRALAREINARRRERNAYVFAIDLPTGLDGNTGEADPDAVTADFTLTIGFAKSGLVADGASNHVGRLAVLPLPQLTAQGATGPGPGPGHVRGEAETAIGITATPANLASLLPRRKAESHKTQFGRIGVLAGSVGFTGAALLTAQGALHAGAGLVSIYATRDIHPVLAAAASPEIMVKPVESYRELFDTKRDVLAAGPGLGHARADEVLDLLERCDESLVVDADALNILAKTGSLDRLGRCAGPRLLTPHPGEMTRLLPEAGKRPRREIVELFTERYPVALLLKGSRTIVGEKGKPLSYNTTGSPGLASGGSGDVLTGVCAALIGQGLSAYDAGRLGAWLCGRAAELAIFNGPHSEESLSAMVVVQSLGEAFRELREHCY